MPPIIRTALKLLVCLTITGLSLWFAFRGVDIPAIRTAMSQANPLWLSLCSIIFILSIAPRAWRWQILLRPVTTDISLWRLSVATLIAYAGNNVFPRAGEIARAVEVKRGRNLPLSAILATVLVERVIDILIVVVLFGVVLFEHREEVGSILPNMEIMAIAAFVGSIVLLLLFPILSRYSNSSLLIVRKYVGKVSGKMADRIVEMLKALFQGLGSVQGGSAYVGIIVSSTLLNFFYIMATYVALLSFDFTYHEFGILDAMVVTVISTAGIIFPTPGGVGAYHLVCSQALYRLYDIPLAEALAFATVIHGIVFITYLIAGGPGLLRLLFQNQLSNSN